MGKQRIYFGNIVLHYPFLPYQWGILRAFAESDPAIADAYEFEAPMFMYSHVHARMSRIEAPFMFAVSCYVWNFSFHMKLCRTLKERFKHCIVVAGGPHIPDHPGGFFQRHPYVDILVHGEGEWPFRSLLGECLKSRPELESVPNISYQHKGESISTRLGVGSLPREILDGELPSPYLLGYFDDMLDHVRTAENRVWALWETSRGCPYACTFCEWGAPGFNAVKRFTLERLYQEIDWFAASRLEGVYSADANFGMFERDVDLAQRLVQAKKRAGSPTYFMTNFAKNSNERVFQAGKLFTSAGMSRGTILAMQSTSDVVLDAIKRKNISKKNYQLLNERYRAEGIPTYTDLIVPLPKETRESWFNGLCDLFSCGQHENIRVHELALLPNTPMASPEERLKYGLQTVEKRLFGPWPRDEWGTAEIVYATNTMSFEEWVDCRTFHFVICQALHNGGYTRCLSMFLNHQGLLTYHDFYISMFEMLRQERESFIGHMIRRISALVENYVRNDELQQPMIANQRDLVEDLCEYSRRGLRYWHVFEWPWLRINENMDRFYGEIAAFLRRRGIDTEQPELAEVMTFQRDIMLTVHYDPAVGKRCRYRVNWPRYFFGDGEMRSEPVEVRFSDRAMGMDQEDKLVAESPAAFLQAACGSYSEGGTVRRYFHQPDRMWLSIDGAAERPAVTWGTAA